MAPKIKSNTLESVKDGFELNPDGGKAAARAGRRKFEQIRRPRSRAPANPRFLWLIGGRFVRQNVKKLKDNNWKKSRRTD